MKHDSTSPDSSSSVSQAGPTLGLPSQSMQNQIHELAKSLPTPRKQNIACDACRQRKVKCHQLPGQSKCQHCTVKNYPCTHHAQQATSEKKRITSVSRRPRSYSTNNQRLARPPNGLDAPREPGADGFDASFSDAGSDKPAYLNPQTTPLSPANSFTFTQSGFGPPVNRNTTFTELLRYLLSPPDDPDLPDHVYAQAGYRPSPWKQWGELAYKLEDETFRVEFAVDLVEVYFQIVHTRLPFLDPTRFRAKLNVKVSHYASGQYMSNQADTEEPLHPALMATVVAWGAKFSEHPLLIADRHASGTKHSNLAMTLISRAREVAEALKVHRVPDSQHIVIALLIEPLQSQIPEDASGVNAVIGFRGFWLTSAIRQLFELQINHKSTISNIQDPEHRGTMIFAWWMACLSDAYGAAYYRRKPQVDDADYDVDFYTAETVSMDPADGQHGDPHPREHLEFLGYYRAAHALAKTSRHMSKELWTPKTDSEGVSIDVLHGIMVKLNEWHEIYLPHVGVPKNFAAEWDFVSAVSACASDATFHIMWIILFNALDDYGVRELNEVMRAGGSPSLLDNYEHIEAMKRKVHDEALHGALRIAGLAGVLTKNGYLRLDPAVMHVSCNRAGDLLARLGRPEVENCIHGLEQYSYSYEEAADQAAELHRLYELACNGKGEFNHMASVIARGMPAVISRGASAVADDVMYVDSPQF
ncbi:hypothetical protein BV25DRAFT_1916847 [Artomyces pyxidatus]|uniref:Uncharacterized protein n=1 Tax=Artomyces pyxidatus TaxID=48021 RepID=A0ACB8T034_9AGAM|nr:hypothetical protein BV25DRAFT_1916847 [Artomyces pyxidatus]